MSNELLFLLCLLVLGLMLAGQYVYDKVSYRRMIQRQLERDENYKADQKYIYVEKLPGGDQS